MTAEQRQAGEDFTLAARAATQARLGRPGAPPVRQAEEALRAAAHRAAVLGAWADDVTPDEEPSPGGDPMLQTAPPAPFCHVEPAESVPIDRHRDLAGAVLRAGLEAEGELGRFLRSIDDAILSFRRAASHAALRAAAKLNELRTEVADARATLRAVADDVESQFRKVGGAVGPATPAGAEEEQLPAGAEEEFFHRAFGVDAEPPGGAA